MVWFHGIVVLLIVVFAPYCTITESDLRRKKIIKYKYFKMFTIISVTMTKYKNTNQIDNEAENGYDKQSFMFNMGWMKGSL